METLHLIINIFAGGRSEVKIYLFFLYLAVLLCIYAYYKKKSSGTYTQTKIALGICFGVLFSMGLIQHLILLQTLGLDLFDTVIIFNHEEISSTTLLHNHTMKGSMGVLFSLFGSGVFEGVDVGTAFIGLLPNWIMLLGLLLLCVSFVYIIKLFVFLMREHVKRNYMFVLAYAVFSFSILKNLIDGGILNKETIPALLGLFLLVIHRKTKKFQIVYGAVLLITTSLLIFTLITPVRPIPTIILNILGICSLVIGLVYAAIFEKNIYRTVCISIICILSLSVVTRSDRNLIQYITTTIYAGTNIYLQSRQEISYPNLEKIHQIGDMRYYSGPVTKDTRVESLIDLVGSPTNFRPVSIPLVTCSVFNPRQIDEFDIFTEEEISKERIAEFLAVQNNYVSVTKFYKIETTNSKDYSKYRVQLSRHPCVARKIETMQQLFTSFGFTYFIITNPDA